MTAVMSMPADFKYRDVFLLGRPKHQRFDAYWRKHPTMDPGHRAKLFSPFAALAGFDDEIDGKEIIYVSKRVLSEEETDNLSAIYGTLHDLTYNGKAARASSVAVTLEYFVICSDPHSEWCGTRGLYKTITGVVMNVDEIYQNIRLATVHGEKVIAFNDISYITIEGNN